MSLVEIVEDESTGQSGYLRGTGGVAQVNNVGAYGNSFEQAFWADTVYADADKWTSATGCNEFHVRPFGALTAGTHALIVAWSTTEDADLSAVIASLRTGPASVAKTAKEATLTGHANAAVLTRDTQELRRYSRTPIKTIRIVAVANDKVCLLTTVTE